MPINLKETGQQLLAIYNMLARPQVHFLNILKSCELTPASQQIFMRDHSTPFHSIENILLKVLKDRYSPIYTGDFFDNNQTQEDVMLRDIYGCTASKSPYPDFNEMAKNPYCVLPQNKEEASLLAADVFESDMGGISSKDDLAHLVRQAWDNQQWFINSDGSHRSSALWVYDRENNIDRPIPCNVTSIDINADFRKFATDHDTWLCDVQSRSSLSQLQEALHPNIDTKGVLSGIKIRHVSENGYGVIVSKASPLYPEIKSIMLESSATNLSEWVKAPQCFGFDKDHALLTDQKFRP